MHGVFLLAHPTIKKIKPSFLLDDLQQLGTRMK